MNGRDAPGMCRTKRDVLREQAERRILALEEQNAALQATNVRLYMENQELKQKLSWLNKPAPGIKPKEANV